MDACRNAHHVRSCTLPRPTVDGLMQNHSITEHLSAALDHYVRFLSRYPATSLVIRVLRLTLAGGCRNQIGRLQELQRELALPEHL